MLQEAHAAFQRLQPQHTGTMFRDPGICSPGISRSYREQIPDLRSRLKERKGPLGVLRDFGRPGMDWHMASARALRSWSGTSPNRIWQSDCSTGQLVACPECAQNATCLSQWPMQEAASFLHSQAPSVPMSLMGGTCSTPRLPTQGQTDRRVWEHATQRAWNSWRLTCSCLA